MRLDRADAFFVERFDRFAQNLQTFEKRVSRVRHHDVELQLPGFGAKGERGVLADDVKTDHVDHLRHAGIDLARHDRRTGLRGGQLDLVKPGVRTGIEEPEIVADLAELDAQRAQAGGDGIRPCFSLLSDRAR